MATKREIINAAFGELGLSGYAVDMQPEEQADALRLLNAMLSMWTAGGLRLGYAGAGTDLSEDMGTPPWADEAIALGLALRLAPSFGKAVSAETRTAAKAALTFIQSKCAQPSTRPMAGYAGGGRQITLPVAPIDLGNDASLDFIKDF